MTATTETSAWDTAQGLTIMGGYLAGLVGFWWPMYRTFKVSAWLAATLATVLAVAWPVACLPWLSYRLWTGRWMPDE